MPLNQTRPLCSMPPVAIVLARSLGRVESPLESALLGLTLRHVLRPVLRPACKPLRHLVCVALAASLSRSAGASTLLAPGVSWVNLAPS